MALAVGFAQKAAFRHDHDIVRFGSDRLRQEFLRDAVDAGGIEAVDAQIQGAVDGLLGVLFNARPVANASRRSGSNRNR